MPKTMKMPSNASIRRSLTVIKKAGFFWQEPIVYQLKTHIELAVPNDLMSKKRSIRKKKVC